MCSIQTNAYSDIHKDFINTSQADSVQYPKDMPEQHRNEIKQTLQELEGQKAELAKAAQAAVGTDDYGRLNSLFVKLKRAINEIKANVEGFTGQNVNWDQFTTAALKPQRHADLKAISAALDDVGSFTCNTRDEVTSDGTSSVSVSDSCEASEYSKMTPDKLLRKMESDPEGFYRSLGDLPSEERNVIMMRLNQEIQTNNQIFSAISNMQKALHDTQKAVLANLRV